MRFPWRYMLVVGMLMAGCLLLAACGGEEGEGATPTPSPMPSPTARPTETAAPGETATAAPTVTPTSRAGPEREVPRPPSAVLRAGDALQTGGIGTYYWGNFFADPFGLVVPTEFLPLATGEPLVLELGFDPVEVHVMVWRVDQGEVVVGEPLVDAFNWLPARSEEPVLEETPPPAHTIELRPDLPPGTYIVHVFADAAVRYAAYGFHLEVVP